MINPLESLFDIEPGSTPTLQTAVQAITPALPIVKTELSPEEFDKEERIEDIQVDTQLQEIHTAAMQAFYQQHTTSQQVDPKFSARNAEIAAQFLNTALSTISTRVDAKYKRQKIRIAKKMDPSTASNVQNNVIFADRNSLMKSLFKQDFEKGFHEQLNNEIYSDKL